ncbi:hypothetical protein MYMA111404_01425 [Mycoplasma marinum]|uniref:Uncharacterized protein n=1 Tax=Mycoplasma marinum TaxID=1937190 RepID=A0A4R0XL82_9MOLU|nr:hypothetical protein [Mycoplasma marinum]TCG11416.1 hypothetical protein C4B24_01955 [Mycoplasma marinum]
MNRKIKISIGVVIATAVTVPLAISIANNTSTSSVFYQGRRTLVRFLDKTQTFSENRRIWDENVQSSSLVSSSRDLQFYKPLTTMPFDQVIDKSSVVIENPDGSLKEVKKEKSHYEFGGVSSVQTDSGKYDSYKKLTDSLSKKKTRSLTLRVKPGIHYVNNHGEVTKYEYKAIDIFYGFMRGIYNNKEVRQLGTIMGKNPMPPIEKDYMQRILNSDEYYENGALNQLGFNNGNVYLNNLYGIDLKGTINANTGANYDPDKFTIKYTMAQDASILVNNLSLTNQYNPMSSQKILELNGGQKSFDKPGKFLQLLEFGKTIRHGEEVDLSQELTVGRFYLESYNTDPLSSGIVLKKNKHSYKEKWNKNNKTLNKIEYLFNDGSDADVYAQIRQQSFLRDNSESVLNNKVLENANLMRVIKSKKFGTKRRITEKGMTRRMIFNPWYFASTKNSNAQLDNNTSRLLFNTTRKQIASDPNADIEYFSGRGRIFRSLLNASINLFGISKQWLEGSELVKVAQGYKQGLKFNTGVPITEEWKKHPRTGLSHGISKDVDQMNWYIKNNTKSSNEFLKPTEDKYKAVKEGWAKFIKDSKKELGIKGDFVFPLIDFKATDKVDTPNTRNAYNKTLNYLNNLTKGTGISFKEFIPTSDKSLNANNKTKTAPLVYIGAGADYDSSISLTQQLLSATYGASVLYNALKEAYISGPNYNVRVFDNSDQNKWNLTKTISIKDFVDFMKSDKENYTHALDKKLLKQTNLKDWMTFRTGEDFDNKNIGLALNEIDNAAQKFFFQKSSDENIVRKYTNLMASYAITDKLAFGDKTNASLGTQPNATIQTKEIYMAPWLHIAQSSDCGEIINIVDSYVD